MDKKRTKEIREVVAEASSGSIGGGETTEQQPQPRRKRGRPRKNIQIDTEVEEGKNQEEEQKQTGTVVEEGDSKRMKSSDVEQQMKGISSSSVVDVKGGTGPSDESKTKETPSETRRVRRKSQPRKST